MSVGTVVEKELLDSQFTNPVKTNSALLIKFFGVAAGKAMITAAQSLQKDS